MVSYLRLVFMVSVYVAFEIRYKSLDVIGVTAVTEPFANLIVIDIDELRELDLFPMRALAFVDEIVVVVVLVLGFLVL